MLGYTGRIFGLAILLGMAAWTAAHGQPAGKVLYVVEQEDIDPARTESYEEGVQLAIASMAKARLGPEVSWEATQHGASYFYVFQVGSLAELDLDSPEMRARNAQLARAMDEAAYGRFASLTTPAIRGNHLSVLEPVAEFSYQPSRSVVQAPKYNYVDILRVQAARVERFKTVIRKIVAALEKSGYPIAFHAYRTVIGDGKVFFDSGRTYYFVAPYDSHAQFYDEHPITDSVAKAVGDEAARGLFSEMRQCLVDMESYDYVRRPDMGYRSAKK